MDELIARLEAATGPDRELDAAIALAVGYTTYPDGYGDGNEWIDPQGNHLPRAVRMGAQPPKFTASIDAALTLVPDGCLWGAGDEDCTGRPWAWCLPPGRSWDDADNSYAATPALAICIAVLKARGDV